PGEALRHAARHAFVHGLHVTLLVSAGLLLLGAVMALRLPRAMECGAAAGVEVPGPREAESSLRVESVG
ncbi:MFS transporter, partial [Streptomyces sp. ActVer]|nr:MFS transporter [Streptomyces sp. ActVer]